MPDLWFKLSLSFFSISSASTLRSRAWAIGMKQLVSEAVVQVVVAAAVEAAKL